MDVRTQKRLDEIGTRFIRGSVDQLAVLQSLAARIHDGDLDGLSKLEHLTHQLHGSAALFRFDQVSSTAGKINRLLKSFGTETDQWDVGQLDTLLIDFSDAVHDAAAGRRRRADDQRLEWPEQGSDAASPDP